MAPLTTLVVGAVSCADHVPTNRDIQAARPSLAVTEGYLHFRAGVNGDEYTGHTDSSGRDFPDNWISVRPIRLQDSQGMMPVSASESMINADFEFIRKIYAQAGIAVRRLPTLEQTLDVTWAKFNSEQRVKAANLQNNDGGVINLFYARSFSDTTHHGVSRPPVQVGGTTAGDNPIDRPFSFVRDNRSNNTSAHEVGHQLLNADALWREDAVASSESFDRTNLMFVRGGQSAHDLDDVGQRLSGTVGGHDIIEYRQDGTNAAQISRMHENGGPRGPAESAIPEFVLHSNNHDTHGDVADFDWVSDRRLLESIINGGNGADRTPGTDSLVWQVADTNSSRHVGPGGDDHVHDQVDNQNLFLSRPAFGSFGQQFFKSVDVFSNINRYADNDISVNTGMISARSKALDYNVPEFSADGVTWFPGTLANVFIPGWTDTGVSQDDYVARWTTDVEAKFLRISAAEAGVDGHDGNTQIDAIMAHELAVTELHELLAGDSNQDLSFDQWDIVQVLKAARYLSGQPSTWGEGDWNGAPGGIPGDPPDGDGLFDQQDILDALQAGLYLSGSYVALRPTSMEGGRSKEFIHGNPTGAGSLGEEFALVQAQLVNVPEPSTFGMLLLGMMAVAGKRMKMCFETSNTRTDYSGKDGEEPALACGYIVYTPPRRLCLLVMMIVAAATVFAHPKTGNAGELAYQIVHSYPHDTTAFTQGLAFDDNGVLFEGTGKYGQSSLRRVDFETGQVLQSHSLEARFFGEGITVMGDRIIQLTWRENVGFVYDKDTFALREEFQYPTEGWGITHDGDQLIMSKGSSELDFLDPHTFEVSRSVTVRDADGPITRLNELEYIDGLIYANVWLTDRIVRIDPRTGFVKDWLDMTGLLDLPAGGTADVLNGIAYDDATDRLLVTGKLWPQMFQVRIVPEMPSGPLHAGDADQDLDFDQQDLVMVQIAGKYLSGQGATWGDGDWNGAPGGQQGNPPLGDGLFNQFDIIAAQQAAVYLSGPYAAARTDGNGGDGADGTIFKTSFDRRFGHFGNAVEVSLSDDYVTSDRGVIGSMEAEFVYVPEQSSALLLAIGLCFGIGHFRRLNR